MKADYEKALLKNQPLSSKPILFTELLWSKKDKEKEKHMLLVCGEMEKGHLWMEVFLVQFENLHRYIEMSMSLEI